MTKPLLVVTQHFCCSKEKCFLISESGTGAFQFNRDFSTGEGLRMQIATLGCNLESGSIGEQTGRSHILPDEKGPL